MTNLETLTYLANDVEAKILQDAPYILLPTGLDFESNTIERWFKLSHNGAVVIRHY